MLLACAVGITDDRVQQQEQAVAVRGELHGVSSRGCPVPRAELELAHCQEQIPAGLALALHDGLNLNARDILAQGKPLACWCV